MAKTEPFDKYPLRYDRWFKENKFAFESEVGAIRKLLPERGRGIEVGVGSGRFAVSLGIRLGIEPSREMVKISKARGISVIRAVAEELPFYDKSFDFVLMVTTVCFLDNVNLAFREVYRVLKPGGFFLIGFIDRESKIGKFYEKQKKGNVFYRIAAFYSVEEVVRELEKVGFKEFKFTQTLFHNLKEINEIEPVKEGYGEGSFVVIRGKKIHSSIL